MKANVSRFAFTFAVNAAACSGSLKQSDRVQQAGKEELSGAYSGGSCKAFKGPLAPASPMLRLTNLQYKNTLHDLFAGIVVPLVNLPMQTATDGFFNDSKSQGATANTVEIFRTAAQVVSKAAMAKPEQLLSCAPANPADERSCAHSFIKDFGKRAFRRPMTTAELDSYKKMFETAQEAYGFEVAAQLVVQSFLQSPHFLYRVERGGVADPQKGGLLKLNSYEMASRLSYFLWNSMPDAALMARADSHALDSAGGIEAEARRMLADPRARGAVATFHQQWITNAAFDKSGRQLNANAKSHSKFPKWNDQVATSLRANTEQYLEYLFWDLGRFWDFFTDAHAYVDANTAWIYGVAVPTDGASALVEMPKGQRAGILTQAGLMAGFSHATMDSPVFRGFFVMNQLLCLPPAAPPANVPAITPLAAVGTETTRDHYANIHTKSGAACESCHESMDGFGFTFEHYDAVGQWRTIDNGLPVNAKVTIDLTPDLNGDIDGAVELGHTLANSMAAKTCMAATWFRYALGLGAGEVDACQLEQVMSEFAKNDYRLPDLLVSVVKSDAFRYKQPAKL